LLCPLPDYGFSGPGAIRISFPPRFFSTLSVTDGAHFLPFLDFPFPEFHGFLPLINRERTFPSQFLSLHIGLQSHFELPFHFPFRLFPLVSFSFSKLASCTKTHPSFSSFVSFSPVKEVSPFSLCRTFPTLPNLYPELSTPLSMSSLVSSALLPTLFLMRLLNRKRLLAHGEPFYSPPPPSPPVFFLRPSRLGPGTDRVFFFKGDGHNLRSPPLSTAPDLGAELSREDPIS